MKIVVFGAGESGTGAALLAAGAGHEVFVTEANAIGAAARERLEAARVSYEERGHTFAKLRDADLVIKSPGIPDDVPVLLELKALGIEIIGEIEYAYRFLPQGAKIIGITGSNGKTTTTLLTYHLLYRAGVDVGLGGNVGKSFASLLMEEPKAWYVLELSSFQLDGIRDFRPDIAMILNITPDHLDRYDYQMEKYVSAKFRIVKNMDDSGVCLINGDDPVVKGRLEKTETFNRWESLSNEQIEGKRICSAGDNFDVCNPMLQGRHNRMNALFAVRAAQLVGVGADQIQLRLDTFVNHPHRLEPVGEVEGIAFINDSKATNTDAVFYALDAMQSPVIWIVGGQDKGNDYAELLPLVREKVKAIVCMGVDNSPLFSAFGELNKPMVEVRSARAAVEKAYALGERGDTVLLSPACASFDLFRNYVDRGDQFRSEVEELSKRIKEIKQV